MTDVETALDLVAKLKADRRAELKAAYELENQQRQERIRREIAEYEEAITKVLAAHGAEWLAGFRPTDTYPPANVGRWHGRDLRDIPFEVMGHRLIYLRLSSYSGGWEPADIGCSGEVTLWQAKDDTGGLVACDTLADALIAAEIVEPNPDDAIPF